MRLFILLAAIMAVFTYAQEEEEGPDDDQSSSLSTITQTQTIDASTTGVLTSFTESSGAQSSTADPFLFSLLSLQQSFKSKETLVMASLSSNLAPLGTFASAPSGASSVDIAALRSAQATVPSSLQSSFFAAVTQAVSAASVAAAGMSSDRSAIDQIVPASESSLRSIMTSMYSQVDGSLAPYTTALASLATASWSSQGSQTTSSSSGSSKTSGSSSGTFKATSSSTGSSSSSSSNTSKKNVAAATAAPIAAVGAGFALVGLL